MPAANPPGAAPGTDDRSESIRSMVGEWREAASPREQAALDLYTSGKVKLPAIPKVAAKLVPMLSRANADIGECVKLIEVDRVLAGAMLKCANSVAFFRGVATTNIRDAVMRIGLKGSAALALSLSTTALYDQRVKKALTFIGSDYETEWRRSVLIAHAARDIANDLDRGEPDLAFTGGLFQNVGDSLAAFVLATMAVKDPSVAAMPIEAQIATCAGLRGVLMGEYVLRESLPDALSGLCMQIDEPLDREVSPTTLVVRLTLALTTHAEMDATARSQYLARGLAAAKTLGLDKDRLAAVKDVVTAASSSVDAFAGQLRTRKR